MPLVTTFQHNIIGSALIKNAPLGGEDRFGVYGVVGLTGFFLLHLITTNDFYQKEKKKKINTIERKIYTYVQKVKNYIYTKQEMIRKGRGNKRYIEGEVV